MTEAMGNLLEGMGVLRIDEGLEGWVWSEQELENISRERNRKLISRLD